MWPLSKGIPPTHNTFLNTQTHIEFKLDFALSANITTMPLIFSHDGKLPIVIHKGPISTAQTLKTHEKSFHSFSMPTTVMSYSSNRTYLPHSHWWMLEMPKSPRWSWLGQTCWLYVPRWFCPGHIPWMRFCWGQTGDCWCRSSQYRLLRRGSIWYCWWRLLPGWWDRLWLAISCLLLHTSWFSCCWTV
jgi:hypothetical protein